MLDFRIETFLMVCRYMNFTKAASKLHITQPAVSQQIHYLEEYFGATLFHYEKRKLTLTPAGEMVLLACTTFANDQQRLLERVNELKKAGRKVTFGATLTIGEYVLPPKLAHFLEKYPKHPINMLVKDTDSLLKDLDEGKIEFAFIEGYFPKDQYDYITWSKEKLLPVCKAHHPVLSQLEITFYDLFPLPLILREKGSGTRDTLEHFLACANISVHDFASVIEIGGVEAIKTLVSQGAGISFLYESAIQTELSNKTLTTIPLREHLFYNDFSFIWRKDSLYANEYKHFFKALQL